MKVKIRTFLIRNWAIILIGLSAFTLRVWNLSDLFYFSYDEEIPAFVARRLIIWHHLPLIGGVTPFGFHLAPYSYWLMSILLFVGNQNPVVWGIFGAIGAIFTTFLVYLVGKSFISKRLGYYAATIWAFSFLANVYDRHLWALYWGPITALVTIFSLFKIIKGHYKFIYILGLTFAFAIHTDLSNYVFVLFTALVFIIYKIPLKRDFFIASGIVLLSFLPLVFFDLRHNFANSAPALSQLTAGGQKNFKPYRIIDSTLLFPKTMSRLIYVFGDNEIAKNYSYCSIHIEEKYQNIPPLVVAFCALLILTSLVWIFKKKNTGWMLISGLILIYFVSIEIYVIVLKGEIFEHYLSGILPLLALILAWFINLMPQKIGLVVLGIFLIINLQKLSVAHSGLGLTAKKEAIQYTMDNIGTSNFSLDSLSSCQKYAGYRYLFAAFGKEPVKSFVDPNLAYLYGITPVAEKHPPIVVSFILEGYVPETESFYQRLKMLKSHQIKSARFGDIEVLILDNSSGWFE